MQARLTESGCSAGIVYVSSSGQEPCCVRIQELEAGFFCDVEASLGRIVPHSLRDRERKLLLLLGGRTEGIPFADGKLSLGTWQRVLLFGFGPRARGDWHVTVLGA